MEGLLAAIHGGKKVADIKERAEIAADALPVKDVEEAELLPVAALHGEIHAALADRGPAAPGKQGEIKDAYRRADQRGVYVCFPGRRGRAGGLYDLPGAG